jgi:hypothetical protein
MPLVHADHPTLDEPLSARHERARKVKPQYSQGPLVKVAGSRHQSEAELIQGLLLEEGVPSMLRRSRGFDVPDMLAAGPRDVLVPASGAQAARDVLLQADLIALSPSIDAVGPRPARLLAALLVAVAAVGLIAWIGTELLA